MNRTARFLSIGAATLLLGGCLETGSEAEHQSGTSDPRGNDESRSLVSVAFDPANQVLPFPNNLLFEADPDGTLDGTLNAPIDDPEDDSAALVEALNELDGFSTVAPWRMEFTGPVDPESLIAGETVRVFKGLTQDSTYPGRTHPTSIDRELEPGDEFRLEYNDETHELLIIPTQPLAFDTTYTAVVTKGIKDEQGLTLSAPLQWSIARGDSLLDQCDADDRSDSALLQCTTNPTLTPVVSDSRYGLERDNLLLSWGVTTQRRDTTFLAVADLIAGDGHNTPQYASHVACSTPLCFLDVENIPGHWAINPDNFTTPDGNARMWPGTLQLSSMLDEAEDANYEGDRARDDGILSTHWQCENAPCNSDKARGALDEGDVELPRQKARHTVPVILATPDPEVEGVPEPPENGYPLVIFQHAIQQDRTNALALADELATRGVAVIGIDMPLHGLVLNQLGSDSRGALHATSINKSLEQANIEGALPRMMERTQYLDLVDAEGNEGSDGTIDPSGAHFINPAQPLNQRDLLRQGAADLVALSHYLRSDQFQQCGAEDDNGPPHCDQLENLGNQLLDTSRLHFAGHSLGNLVAAPFLAYDRQIESIAMLSPLGSVMETLRHSDTIGPQLDEGLAESGVEPGTEDYYRFFAVVQAALDGVDTINHGEALTTKGDAEQRPVYLVQIVGNDGQYEGLESPADLVLPPRADHSAPLAGTTPLAQTLGLNFIPANTTPNGSETITPGMQADGTTPESLQVAVSFLYGSHASPLLAETETEDPRSEDEDAMVHLPRGEEVHDEIQRQIGDFFEDNSEITVDTTLVRIEED